MDIPARHLRLTFLGGLGKYVSEDEPQDEPPIGGVPLRAISADWHGGRLPSPSSTVYVQPRDKNLFIYDGNAGELWHLTLPQDDLQRMRETEQVVIFDQPPPQAGEGSEITMFTLPVRPDEELVRLVASRN